MTDWDKRWRKQKNRRRILQNHFQTAEIWQRIHPVKFEKVGSVVAGVGTAIAAAAAAIGAVVVAASVELVKLGDEYNKAVNQISASTGATGTELEELGVIAQKVYTNNFGDSLEDVAEGLSVVQKTTGLVGDELQKATESGFALRDTSDMICRNRPVLPMH